MTTFHKCNKLNWVTITVTQFLIQIGIQMFRVLEYRKEFKNKQMEIKVVEYMFYVTVNQKQESQ
jgi:aryl carrier-like protein